VVGTGDTIALLLAARRERSTGLALEHQRADQGVSSTSLVRCGGSHTEGNAYYPVDPSDVRVRSGVVRARAKASSSTTKARTKPAIVAEPAVDSEVDVTIEIGRGSVAEDLPEVGEIIVGDGEAVRAQELAATLVKDLTRSRACPCLAPRCRRDRHRLSRSPA
jgi:hypothetical protein